jgi:hypothetical protein
MLYSTPVLWIDFYTYLLSFPMKLMDQLRQKLRLLHYSDDTEKSYVRWVERFLIFHKRGDIWRHPNEMGRLEIEQFLSHLACDRHVSASTQNQAHVNQSRCLVLIFRGIS